MSTRNHDSPEICDHIISTSPPRQPCVPRAIAPARHAQTAPSSTVRALPMRTIGSLLPLHPVPLPWAWQSDEVENLLSLPKSIPCGFLLPRALFEHTKDKPRLRAACRLLHALLLAVHFKHSKTAIMGRFVRLCPGSGSLCRRKYGTSSRYKVTSAVWNWFSLTGDGDLYSLSELGSDFVCRYG